jgi:hypothetical protein
LYLRSGGTGGSGNVQAVLAFGKADSSSQRSGAAIASIQTTSDADQIGLGFYVSSSTNSLQTMTQAAIITSAGNVGIGTSAPEDPFTVAGSTRFGTTDTTSAYGQLSFGRSGASTGSHILGGVSGSIRFVNGTSLAGTSTERMCITSTGSVGIGTSNPSQPFQVVTSGATAAGIAVTNTTGNANLFLSTSNTGNGTLFFGDTDNFQSGLIQYANTSDALVGRSAGDIRLQTGGANERMRIDSTGNVGIGTSSPTNLLDVNADSIRVRTAQTPATAGAAGNQGEIAWDADYIYVCVATDTWKRVAIATW